MMTRCLAALAGLTTLVLLASADSAWACKESSGLSTDDKGIARRICNEFADQEDVLKVTVRRTTMTIDVTEGYYLGLKKDRETATQLLSNWMSRFQAETGKNAVTVNIEQDGEKVIECKLSLMGKQEITFLEDSTS